MRSTENRKVIPKCHAYGNTSSSTTLGDFRFEKIDYDNVGGWDSTNMRYYSKRSGRYLMCASVDKTSVTNNQHYIYWKVDGSVKFQFDVDDVTSSDLNIRRGNNVSHPIYLKEGEYFSVGFSEGGGQPQNDHQHLFIEYLGE